MTPEKLRGLPARLRAAALALPEATEAFPWGERAFKVKGKAFVFMRADADGLSFSVKLPRSGAHALALPFAEPTHYGLGRHGWVTINVPAKTTRTLETQCLDWVRESYVAVAPAKLAAALKA